uniref:LIM domain-containing protein WLIM2b n=1 Tax=Schistocephalus solidus TaxID=70667 RepID=A0A0X3PFX4_SCHSO
MQHTAGNTKMTTKCGLLGKKKLGGVNASCLLAVLFLGEWESADGCRVKEVAGRFLHDGGLCVLGEDKLLVVLRAVENLIRLLIGIQVQDHIALAAAEATLVPDEATGFHSLHRIHGFLTAYTLLQLWRNKGHGLGGGTNRTCTTSI